MDAMQTRCEEVKTIMLRFLHRTYEEKRAYAEGRGYFTPPGYRGYKLERWRFLRERIETKRKIAECAEGGHVLVVESGRDCDGVEYWGRSRLIPARIEEFDKLHDRIAHWADGPFALAIRPPSERKAIEDAAGERDRTLEAFENGHSYCI